MDPWPLTRESLGAHFGGPGAPSVRLLRNVRTWTFWNSNNFWGEEAGQVGEITPTIQNVTVFWKGMVFDCWLFGSFAGELSWAEEKFRQLAEPQPGGDAGAPACGATDVGLSRGEPWESPRESHGLSDLFSVVLKSRKGQSKRKWVLLYVVLVRCEGSPP